MRDVHLHEKHKDEIHRTRFKIMTYNLLSQTNFKQVSSHLNEKDPCHDLEYRYRRQIAEIE